MARYAAIREPGGGGGGGGERRRRACGARRCLCCRSSWRPTRSSAEPSSRSSPALASASHRASQPRPRLRPTHLPSPLPSPPTERVPRAHARTRAARPGTRASERGLGVAGPHTRTPCSPGRSLVKPGLAPALTRRRVRAVWRWRRCRSAAACSCRRGRRGGQVEGLAEGRGKSMLSELADLIRDPDYQVYWGFEPRAISACVSHERAPSRAWTQGGVMTRGYRGYHDAASSARCQGRPRTAAPRLRTVKVS
jgi:hypothetical protein